MKMNKLGKDFIIKLDDFYDVMISEMIKLEIMVASKLQDSVRFNLEDKLWNDFWYNLKDE